MNLKSLFAAVAMTSLSAIVHPGCTAASLTSENRTVPGKFYGLILRANAQVILNQGTETGIRVEGEQKNVASLSTIVENGALVITGKNETAVTIYITVDDLSLIEVDGSGKIFSSEVRYADMLLLKVNGSGSIRADIRSLSLGMVVKGSGKIYVNGCTGDSFSRVYGTGQVISRNLDSFRTTSMVETGSGLQAGEKAAPARHAVLTLHQ